MPGKNHEANSSAVHAALEGAGPKIAAMPLTFGKLIEIFEKWKGRSDIPEGERTAYWANTISNFIEEYRKKSDLKRPLPHSLALLIDLNLPHRELLSDQKRHEGTNLMCADIRKKIQPHPRDQRRDSETWQGEITEAQRDRLVLNFCGDIYHQLILGKETEREEDTPSLDIMKRSFHDSRFRFAAALLTLLTEPDEIIIYCVEKIMSDLFYHKREGDFDANGVLPSQKSLQLHHVLLGDPLLIEAGWNNAYEVPLHLEDLIKLVKWSDDEGELYSNVNAVVIQYRDNLLYSAANGYNLSKKFDQKRRYRERAINTDYCCLEKFSDAMIQTATAIRYETSLFWIIKNNVRKAAKNLIGQGKKSLSNDDVAKEIQLILKNTSGDDHDNNEFTNASIDIIKEIVDTLLSEPDAFYREIQENLIGPLMPKSTKLGGEIATEEEHSSMHARVKHASSQNWLEAAKVTGKFDQSLRQYKDERALMEALKLPESKAAPAITHTAPIHNNGCQFFSRLHCCLPTDRQKVSTPQEHDPIKKTPKEVLPPVKLKLGESKECLMESLQMAACTLKEQSSYTCKKPPSNLIASDLVLSLIRDLSTTDIKTLINDFAKKVGEGLPSLCDMILEKWNVQKKTLSDMYQGDTDIIFKDKNFVSRLLHLVIILSDFKTNAKKNPIKPFFTPLWDYIYHDRLGEGSAPAEQLPQEDAREETDDEKKKAILSGMLRRVTTARQVISNIDNLARSIANKEDMPQLIGHPKFIEKMRVYSLTEQISARGERGRPDGEATADAIEAYEEVAGVLLLFNRGSADTEYEVTTGHKPEYTPSSRPKAPQPRFKESPFYNREVRAKVQTIFPYPRDRRLESMELELENRMKLASESVSRGWLNFSEDVEPPPSAKQIIQQLKAGLIPYLTKHPHIPKDVKTSMRRLIAPNCWELAPDPVLSVMKFLILVYQFHSPKSPVQDYQDVRHTHAVLAFRRLRFGTFVLGENAISARAFASAVPFR